MGVYNMNNKFLMVSAVFLILFIFCGAASAAKTNTNQISTIKITSAAGFSDERNPDIDGTRVVWQEKDSSGHYAIYYKNLAGGKTVRVHPTTKNQYNPAISGKNIVWEEKNSRNITNIYYKDLASGSVNVLEASTLNQFSPDISDNTVVWIQQLKSVKLRIYYKNLKTGYFGSISPSTEMQSEPAVDGNRVVWTESDKIYFKNLATGKYGELKDTGRSECSPKISGTRVVWLSYLFEWHEYVPAHVYMMNLATGHFGPIKQHWNDLQESPSISGNRVAYVQSSTYDYSIYVLNLADGKIVKVKSFSRIQRQSNPAISGTIVVWEQKLIKSQQHRIYYKNLATGKYGRLT